MLDVCLAGTAGMVPLPKRWLTTLYCSCEGTSMLIDCGEGTQIALAEAGLKLKPIDVICLTHFHADHCAGLPGLLLSMGNAGRTDTLTIVGPKGLKTVMNAFLTIAKGMPYDIGIIEIDPDGEEARTGFLKCGRMIIRPFKADHVVPCLGYTVEVERSGMFLPEKAEALGIPKELWSKLQNGENVTSNGTTFMPSSVLGPERRGIKILYSTDIALLTMMLELRPGSVVCESGEFRRLPLYVEAEVRPSVQAEAQLLSMFLQGLSGGLTAARGHRHREAGLGDWCCPPVRLDGT